MSRGVRILAGVTAVATAILLFAGGLVTSTNSGDAVPDWWFVPLSFGKLLPKMTGGVLFEHGHRLVASAVGLLTLVLAFALARGDRRSWVRRLGWIAFAGVCAQGTLGGVRVLHLAPPHVVAIVHACVAQLFFAAVVALAVVTSRAWETDEVSEAPTLLPRIAAFAAAVTFLQILLGAVRRHTGWGLDVHAAFSLAVAVAVLWAAAEAFRLERFTRTAAALVLLLVAQIALGLASYALVRGGYVRAHDTSFAQVATITGHLVVGGLIYALSVALALRAARCFPRAGSSLSPGTVR
jgi:cytochrome c oxidase assembly protein subunit 15